MNNFEISAILYYADFLSLQHANKPVTDSCKYFYIHGVPMNIAYIVGHEPVYDIDNQWVKKSFEEYTMLRSKYGEEGVLSFINNLCNLGVAGAVNSNQMMKYIHRYDDADQRKEAFKAYKKNKANKVYTHMTRNDEGDLVEEECSKYVAHAEIG